MGFAKGIEHVGMTVPDIETAEKFFAHAFDAQVLYRGLVVRWRHNAGGPAGLFRPRKRARETASGSAGRRGAP